MIGAIRFRYFVTGVYFCGACLIVFGAATQLTYYREYGPMINGARHVESAKAVADISKATEWSRTSKIIALNQCQQRFTKAALTLELLRIDNASEDSGLHSFKEQLSSGERLVKHLLTCSPTNGNFWLRAAMIFNAAEPMGDSFVRSLINSRRYSPAERSVIAGRYSLYDRTQNIGHVDFTKEYSHDLKAICNRPYDWRTRGNDGLNSGGVYDTLQRQTICLTTAKQN